MKKLFEYRLDLMKSLTYSDHAVSYNLHIGSREDGMYALFVKKSTYNPDPESRFPEWMLVDVEIEESEEEFNTLDEALEFAASIVGD